MSSYRDEFYRVDTMEPHYKRRLEILKKYPEIKELFGPDPNTKWICLALVSLNIFMASMVRTWSWGWVIVISWALSGTINHMLSLATHELSHNLGFTEEWKNQALGMFCNLSMGFPSTVTFRKYHLEHHQFQGVDDIDTDIPTYWEAKIILNNSVTKFLFLCTQPAFYALRPQFSSPKSKDALEILNTVLIVASDILVWYFFGTKALFYLVVGTLMGLSLHPVAGHFLAEHYVWDPYQETYSYYGPLNLFAFNVGYHVEHHDFPRIPGSRLPRLRQIAKEYYPANPKYQSWVMVMVNFVLDANMGSYNRVRRTMDAHKDGVAALRAQKRQ